MTGSPVRPHKVRHYNVDGMTGSPVRPHKVRHYNVDGMTGCPVRPHKVRHYNVDGMTGSPVRPHKVRHYNVDGRATQRTVLVMTNDKQLKMTTNVLWFDGNIFTELLHAFWTNHVTVLSSCRQTYIFISWVEFSHSLFFYYGRLGVGEV